MNLKKILKQAANLKEIAKEGKWIFWYDKNLDHLYFAPHAIEATSLLHSLNDEVAIYVDKKSNLNGVFIEYFLTNFVKHETEFKSLTDLLSHETDGFKTVPKAKIEEAEVYKDALQSQILASLVLDPQRENLFYQ